MQLFTISFTAQAGMVATMVSVLTFLHSLKKQLQTARAARAARAQSSAGIGTHVRMLRESL
jgi:hypothetical protein